MPRILYLLLMACLVPLSVSAAEITFKKTGGLDIPPEYQSCQTDEDCTVVQDICSRWTWHPVNKTSVPAINFLFKNAVIDCESISYTKPLAACVSNTCAFIPDKGNCLLHYQTPDGKCAEYCTEKNTQGVCLLPKE